LQKIIYVIGETSMSKIFTRRFRVRYSELGANGWVAPSNYLRYLVETAYDWAAVNQLGWNESEQLGLAWVIRETELEFHRSLGFGDQFDFTIWLMEWRRVRGKRGFKLTTAETGELIAYGTQKVVSLDAATMRPITPPERFMENFRLDNPPQVPIEPFPKDHTDLTEVFKIQRKVEWCDLDTLNMVYNSVYIDYAEEAVRQELAQKGWSRRRMMEMGSAVRMLKLYIKYLSPARWGEMLNFDVQAADIGVGTRRVDIEIKSLTSGEDILNLNSIWKLE
jgi:YbgC/YbaW family acyl-CoA thioester hydrolase